MTVYVDDMYQMEFGRYGLMKMSHMIADTSAELLAMARMIGVAARWLQHAGEPGEHFDIAKSKRELAIAAGAVPITIRQCSAMCARRSRPRAARSFGFHPRPSRRSRVAISS